MTCASDGTWGKCRQCESSSDQTCDPGDWKFCKCENGSEGVQYCNESDERFGECEDCIDSEEEESTDADSCEYDPCIGDICSEDDGCCEHSACNSEIYGEDFGVLENYCFPKCDVDNEDEPCKCGDQCVIFDNGFSTCLTTGEISIDHLTIPVGVDREAGVVIDGDDVEHTVSLDGETVAFDIFYAYWLEYKDDDDNIQRELAIRADGLVDDDNIWSLILTVPEAVVDEGKGVSAFYDEENDMFNFSSDLYSGTIDDNFHYQEMWLESLIDDGEFEIEKTCEPCDTDDAECDICEFSFHAAIFLMRVKLEV